MDLDDLTRESLERELDCFVQLGREEYLRCNHVEHRSAVTYFIKWRGERCDMKAVICIAMGQPTLRFGSRRSAEAARRLGFTIVDENMCTR